LLISDLKSAINYYGFVVIKSATTMTQKPSAGLKIRISGRQTILAVLLSIKKA